jgi:hypothetical protein
VGAQHGVQIVRQILASGFTVPGELRLQVCGAPLQHAALVRKKLGDTSALAV